MSSVQCPAKPGGPQPQLAPATSWLPWLVLLCLWIVLAPAARAQTPVSETVTTEQIQAKLKELDGAAGLDEALKAKLVDRYRQALSYLDAAAADKAAADSYQQTLASVTKEVSDIRQALARPETSPTARVSTRASIAELEQELAKQQAELTAAQTRHADLAQQLEDQTRRPAAARTELAAAKQVRDTVEADLQAGAPPDEPPQLTQARRVLLEARLQRRNVELSKLQQELLSQPSRVQLLGAQRDLAAHQVASLTALVSALQGQLNTRRQQEAETARAETMAARQLALNKHPAVRRVADQNAELSRELETLASSMSKITSERDVLDKQATQLEHDFQNVRLRIDIAGLSEALGRALLEQRGQLPDVRRYRAGAAKREAEIGEIGLARLRVEEQQRNLVDLDQAVDAIMAKEVQPSLPESEQDQIRSELHEVLADQRELLDKLAPTQTAYLRALGDLDLAEKRLVDNAQAYAEFLDQHLLWIPSSPPLGLHTVREALSAGVWLLSPANWADAGQSLFLGILDRPFRVTAAVLLVGGLFAISRRLRLALEAIAPAVGRPTSDRFLLTVNGLGLTLLLALPWPLLLWVVGWRLQAGADAPVFAKAVGVALSSVGLPLLYIRTLLVLCRRHGVAEIHFQWREAVLKLLRRELWLLKVLGMPAMFVGVAMRESGSELFRSSLGTLAFMFAMTLLAVVIERLLRPGAGVAAMYLKLQPQGWLARLRWIWYPLAVLLPLATVVLVGLGYRYTAAELAIRLASTFWLVVGTVIVHDLVIRWLMVMRRQVALRMARERREAARAAAQGPSKEGAVEGGAPPTEQPETDLAAIDSQTRHLLRVLIGVSAVVGLWAIWAQVFPALEFLDQLSLWQHTVVIDGQEQLRPITLANVFLAIAFAIVTAVTARSSPGLLEIVLLQRLSLDAGSRYAVSTVARYAIGALGLVLVFNTIGGSWSQIQWLVAALSVGLGFGLQEIFANFVSGLIILFERPIRVGDTVTVGELTGKVSRIRIRATTITDWDRKEIIVPNKAFITERVVNWTLTDPITRVVVDVGVAYGSDTGMSHRVILEAVRSVPLVLPEPEPRVYFLGFGDSSLNFRIYAYVNELANRLPMTHELHMAVEHGLRANGIEIPYPQRDIHIRSTPTGTPQDGGLMR